MKPIDTKKLSEIIQESTQEMIQQVQPLFEDYTENEDTTTNENPNGDSSETVAKENLVSIMFNGKRRLIDKEQYQSIKEQNRAIIAKMKDSIKNLINESKEN